MAVFPQGYIWPQAGVGVGKNQAAPAPVSLTAAFVPSTFTFEVHEKSRIFCMPTLALGGTEDPGLQIRVDVSFDAGVTWLPGFKIISIPALVVGVSGCFIDLPDNWHGATWRIACRDMRADADTAIVVYAEAVVRGGDSVSHCVEDQPIELAAVMTAGVDGWHAAGAAAALTANFSLLPAAPNPWWVPVGRANELEVWGTTTGGPPTSVEIIVEESMDDGVTIATIPAINSIAAGIVNMFPGQIQFQSAAGTLADGTYVSHRVPVQPGSWVRLQAKRTGAAVNLLARMRLFRV